jgi:ATP-dependent DNA ligase
LLILGIHKKKAFSDACVCYFVFDILYFNGENLMNKPLSYRKQILEKNVKVFFFIDTSRKKRPPIIEETSSHS